ncbi:MAG TPA: hypothetical protein VHK45_01405 [Geminicoccaceae bacterium]|nr:hypothetical protein [Geminicoccaceae bacterium]
MVTRHGADAGSALRRPAGRQCTRRKARAAAEEVANYEGEIGKLRLELGEVKADVRLLKWMTGFLIAVVLGVFALQWQILLRLPS